MRTTFGYIAKLEGYATWQAIGKILENIYNKIGYICFCIMLVSQLKKEHNSYDIRIS